MCMHVFVVVVGGVSTGNIHLHILPPIKTPVAPM